MHIFKHFNEANVHAFYTSLSVKNLSKGNNQRRQKLMVKSIYWGIIFDSE